MNCEDYRQEVAANPAFDEAHSSACEGCRRYRAEMQALDARIALALSLPVPPPRIPELTDLDDAAVVSFRGAAGKRRGTAKPAWFAAAAAVLAAAVLGVKLFLPVTEYDSLGEEILAHLEHEPYALRVTDKAVSDGTLASVVPPELATMDRDIGLITYAQSCVINGKTVPHLVIQGEQGPVTILLLAGETIENAIELEGASYRGVIVPAGRGSVAIVAHRDEALGPIRNNVMKSVTFRT